MVKSISAPQRFPCGKKRQTLKDAQNELTDRERRKIVATVVCQPHRREFADPEAKIVGCAIGRFIVRHKMAVVIVDAVEVYAEARRKWRAAKGVPAELRMDGNGGDFDADTVKKLFDTWKSIESAVATVAGQNALSLINGAAFMDMEIPENNHVPNVTLGLVELAYCTGHLVRPRRG
jgi:hypothetical protein